MLRLSKLIAGIIVLLFAAGSWAQDVTGQYRLNVNQDPGFDDCVWAGTLQLKQTGGNPGSFTGPGEVSVCDVNSCSALARTGPVNGSRWCERSAQGDAIG